MPRSRNPNIEEAEKLYKQGNKLIDISNILNIAEGTIRSWKNRYNWDGEPKKNNATLQKDKRNATDQEEKEISWIDIEKDYITDVRKKPSTLEEIAKKYNVSPSSVEKYANKNNWTSKRKEYAKKLQEKAIEKTANIISNDIATYKLKHLNISDKILSEINAALEDESELYKYVEKLRTGYGPGQFNEEITTETLDTINDSKVVNLVNALEKLQKMQRQTLGVLDAKDIKEKEVPKVDDKPFELPARLIAPSFAATVFDIEDKLHKEYVLYGGRGSTKSSFVGLEIINLIKKNPTMHALACRKVENTLRDSVYNQIKWAIGALDLDNEFNCKLSPLEIEYLPTGQKIYFRGCDDPTKIKSIKPSFGYIGILWLEELDQFAGPEQVRSIEQSAIRGGDDAYIFKTFNPPKTANNWANKYIKIPKENQYQLHNTYLEVPEKWLGKTFVEEADHLKNVNPTAYEHEYLGVANGNGGNVFDNVVIRDITDDEISQFDRISQACDFGWFPDPWAFVRTHFDAARRRLFIFDEHKANKKGNRETYEIMTKEHGIGPNDKVICDSAEPKSIEDYRSYGLFARGAIKGPGSVEYSMKWLQSLTEIIIDNRRCPESAKEFLDYEYERDKDGEVISGYPDVNNHFIDATRYSCNDIWKKKGQ